MIGYICPNHNNVMLFVAYTGKDTQVNMLIIQKNFFCHCYYLHKLTLLPDKNDPNKKSSLQNISV